MKRVCPNCNSDRVVKYGKRRRKCLTCQRTFRVKKQGRKRKIFTDMYLLDRSTFRRVGERKKESHPEVIRKLHQELSIAPSIISRTKKI